MGVEVRFDLSGYIGEHVARMTDGAGWYASPEEYLRDLIRKDIEREHRDFEEFRAGLQEAFDVPSSECVSVTAQDVIDRGRARRRA